MRHFRNALIDGVEMLEALTELARLLAESERDASLSSNENCTV